MESKFTAIFEKEGDWWIGYVEELPGANSQGKSLEETRENLKKAITMVIEANREFTKRETESKEVIKEQISVASL